jgi:sortase A
VISGHRDTHFRFLQDLAIGDIIGIETPGWPDTGVHTATYVVEYVEVIDSRRQDLVLEPARDRLSLVTCYPFAAPLAGGPLRLVITAQPVPQAALRLPEPSSG